MLPFFLSSCNASFTEFGISIPNLWLRFRYLGMSFHTREMIRSRFFSICITHQLKAGSWSIPINWAYSAVSRGCEFFRSERLSHKVEPSIHWQQCCQPAVDCCKYVQLSARTTFWLASFMALGDCLNSSKGYKPDLDRFKSFLNWVQLQN